MARPTLGDVAAQAGVSLSTVNRVLSGSTTVRGATMARVLAAAEAVGFYGTGAIQGRLTAGRPVDRFMVLLQQPGRGFYVELARHLERAAAAVEDRRVELRVEFMADLSPDRVAARMRELGAGRDGLAVVTAEHPLVAEAIAALVGQGTPVLALVSPLSAPCEVGFVGIDNWKVGRTAGWAFDRLCRRPGPIGILVGNHRYRSQDLNESGLRSYLREYGAAFTLVEPLSSFEQAAIADEMTERMLREAPGLVGLYLSGGGITGALTALRRSGRAGPSAEAEGLVVVGHELFDATKAALLDGTLTFVIAHPMERLAVETVAGLIRAKLAGAAASAQRVILPFDVVTRENL